MLRQKHWFFRGLGPNMHTVVCFFSQAVRRCAHLSRQKVRFFKITRALGGSMQFKLVVSLEKFAGRLGPHLHSEVRTCEARGANRNGAIPDATSAEWPDG